MLACAATKHDGTGRCACHSFSFGACPGRCWYDMHWRYVCRYDLAWMTLVWLDEMITSVCQKICWRHVVVGGRVQHVRTSPYCAAYELQLVHAVCW